VQRILIGLSSVSTATRVLILQRAFHAVAGLVTILLLTRILGAEYQGWYYTLLSWAATYALFDVGLSTTMVPIFSHFFRGSRWEGRALVDGSVQLYALLSRAVRWYLVLAITYLFCVYWAGFWFFQQQTAVDFNWHLLWLILLLASAGQLFWLPFFSFLEGGGRISEVYALRLAQGIAGALGTWCLLLLGFGIWAIVAMPFAASLIPALWFAFRQPWMLMMAWRSRHTEFDWRTEVGSLHWRAGISWLSAYLGTQVYIPVLMHLQGADVAGQMGVALALANTVALLAQFAIARRVPMLAIAAANHDWKTLDAQFKRGVAIFAVVFLFFSAGLLLVMMLGSGYAVIQRCLSLADMVGLLGAVFAVGLVGTLASLLRSFRVEPLVWVSLVSTLLSLPMALQGAQSFSASGLVWALFIVNCFVYLPWALVVTRREIHRLRT
jgi:hypothetical protein